MIQKAVQDPLAELILSGKVKDGETVKVAAGPKGLTFNGASGRRRRKPRRHQRIPEEPICLGREVGRQADERSPGASRY